MYYIFEHKCANKISSNNLSLKKIIILGVCACVHVFVFASDNKKNILQNSNWTTCYVT